MTHIKLDRPLRNRGLVFYEFNPVFGLVIVATLAGVLSILDQILSESYPEFYSQIPTLRELVVPPRPESNWERMVRTGEMEREMIRLIGGPKQSTALLPPPPPPAPSLQGQGGSGGTPYVSYSLSEGRFNRIVQLGGGFGSSIDGCLNTPVPFDAAFAIAPREMNGKVGVQVGGLVKVMTFDNGYVTCIQ